VTPGAPGRPDPGRPDPGRPDPGRPDPGRPDPGRPDRRRSIGEAGESQAAAWYEEHGYEVLERNWRRRDGEIDLILRRGRTVVFCEVKTRSDDRFGTGAEAVLASKQRRIRRLASRWLAELTPASGRARVEVRFDVVSITAGRIEVLEDAF